MAKMNFKGVFEAALTIGLILGQIIIGVAMIPVVVILTLVLPGVAAWYIGTELPASIGVFEAISKTPVFISFLLPLPWKKHFMKRLGIYGYGARARAEYYFRYSRAALTIHEMDRESFELLWRDKRLNPMDITRLLNDDVAKRLFKESLSDEDRCAIYLRTRDTRLLDLMSDKGINLIWDRGEYEDRRAIIMDGWRLENYQFSSIKHNKSLIQEYIRRNTPADYMLLAMAKTDYLLDELKYCVQQYGLSPKVIEALSPEVLEELEQTIRCFMQRTFLQRCKNPETIREFFRMERRIEGNAQMAMEKWQYRLFHEAGHKLCPEFVHDVIRRQDVQWLELILELDGKYIDLKDQEEAIISTSPELTDAVFRYLVKRRREEAEASA